MIHTERERNEDRQADRDTVRAAAGRENSPRKQGAFCYADRYKLM